MQYKLYKKSTFILGIIFFLSIASIVILLLTHDKWADNALTVVVIYAVVAFIVNFAYSYYDLNVATNMIKKMVSNHQVALAKVKGGQVVRLVRDAKWRKYCMWQLDIEIIDENNERINTTMIEKFALTQASIPSGYIYVTYDPANPEAIFAVPSVLISADIGFQPMVVNYERKVKPTYLNCYYRYGLVLQTFKQSMKEEKEYKKLMEEE